MDPLFLCASALIATASTATIAVDTSSIGVYNVTVVGKNAPVRRSASEVVRDKEVLEAAPHRSADELLSVVPGVFITHHGGEGKAFQIFYRGFDAVHGQDLEIWAGGAPVNDISNIHGQGYADLHFLPVETVSRLRVTPGTYDPHQGDFAIAGTLHLDLGIADPGVTVKLQGGEFGTRRAFLAYRPEGAPESTFGAVELYHTGGFGPSRAADRASAVAQWVHPIGETSELRLFASAYSGRFSSAGVLRLSDIETGKVDRFATYDPTQSGAASRSQLVAELSSSSDHARWSLAAYGVMRTFRLRENFTGYLNDPNGDSEQQLNEAMTTGAYGSYRRTLSILSDRDAVEVGFFARGDWIAQSQRRLSVADGSVTENSVDARVRALDAAGYVDLSLTPVDFFTLRGGVRADGLGYSAEDQGGAAEGQARSSQGTHIGLKATGEFRIARGFRGLLSYGDGFRSPQARALSEGEKTPFTKVRSVEAGLQLSTWWLSATLAGFRTTLSDDLVFDHATNRNERVPATRRLGISGDLELRVLEGLVIVGSATFTQAQLQRGNDKYDAGDLIPYSPQLVARLDTSYRRELGTVFELPIAAQLGGALSVLGRRPLPYQQFGHDIVLVDARAELEVGPVTVGVDVFNLFDADWYDGEFVFASRWDPNEAGALVPQRMVTVGAPRTVFASVAAGF